MDYKSKNALVKKNKKDIIALSSIQDNVLLFFIITCGHFALNKGHRDGKKQSTDF